MAAGRLHEPEILVPTLYALVAFCLASSATYLVNDIVDLEEDRRHPVKRNRPIAAGVVSAPAALTLAVVLALLSVVAAWLASGETVALILSYLGLQVAYSLWLKHEPVLDLAVVAAGFLLRAVAGGVATDLPISQSFLLVAGFGSLYIVSGKRYSELHTLGSEVGTRRSLVRYSPTYLRFVWTMAGTATVVAYSLWAFEQSGDGGPAWHAVSIAPFVLGVLRYAADIDAGEAAEPEDIVWGDRVLQAVGVIWFVFVSLGVLNA